MDSRSTDGQPRVAEHDFEKSKPIRNWEMDPRLDFPRSVPLRKSYIVASSYRCGSTFFCSELWRTGVLGAPGEYLNIGEGKLLRDMMMSRLQAASPEDYFLKLLTCRTSSNGMFGMKVHFHHFEPALSWYPSMIAVLSPVTYIYLNRRDKLAQAVSMAKAMQTCAWTSLDSTAEMTLRYDEAFITQCLEDIEQQRLGWMRWFEINNITPFVVNYEDLVADNKASVIRSIVELLDVQNDEPEEVRLPVFGKQGDETNIEWAARFRREDDRPRELDGRHGGIWDSLAGYL